MFRVVANEPEWVWLQRLAAAPVPCSLLPESAAELVLGLRDRFLVANVEGALTLTVVGMGFVLAAPGPDAEGLRVWAEYKEPIDADTTSIGRDRGSLPEAR